MYKLSHSLNGEIRRDNGTLVSSSLRALRVPRRKGDASKVNLDRQQRIPCVSCCIYILMDICDFCRFVYITIEKVSLEERAAIFVWFVLVVLVKVVVLVVLAVLVVKVVRVVRVVLVVKVVRIVRVVFVVLVVLVEVVVLVVLVVLFVLVVRHSGWGPPCTID